MSLRDRLKSTVKSVLNKFSGEYSAAEGEIRTPPPEQAPRAGADVKVTRARLKRPPGSPDQG